MNDREYVNEVLGLHVLYRTIQAMPKADEPITGHQVAERVHQNYGHIFSLPAPGLWNAIERVADEELAVISRKPDNLAAALIGLDLHVRAL